MSDPSLLVWIDGALLPADAAHATPFDQGLHYGLGVFEGIRAYAIDGGCTVFRLDDHLARMARGAALLGMDLDTAALRDGIDALCRANRLGDAYIRPIAWLGDGQGLKLDVANLHVRMAIKTLPLASHLSAAARARGLWLQTSAWARNRADSIPPLKLTGGYVNAVLAKRAAMLAGFDGALFTSAGQLVEASAENLGFVKDGRIHLVSHPDALPGITRDTIADLADAHIGPAPIEALETADEVFVCGTSAEVQPVTRIDDRTWAPGPITAALQARYAAIVRGQDAAFEGWQHRVAHAATTARVA